METESSSGKGWLQITLLLRRRAELPSIADLCTQASLARLPFPRHREVEERYGLAPADLEPVRKFASKYQLSLEEPQSESERLQMSLRGAVRLTGTLTELSSAFGIELHRRVDRRGEFFAHAQPLPVPPELKEVARFVVGLAPVPLPRPKLPADSQAPEPLCVTASDAGQFASTIARHYGVPPGLRGEGQCLGLLQLNGGFRPADLEAYFRELDIQPELVVVGENHPGQPLADLEVTLDVELAAAICPKARLVTYLQNSRRHTIHDLWWLFATAITDTDNYPSVLSLSWSFVEGINISEHQAKCFGDLFTLAALLGITLCASTGDTGALVPIGAPETPTGASLLPATVFPASSPLVLGCGGTRLEFLQDGTTTEEVWNQLSTSMSFQLSFWAKKVTMSTGSSGGGISLFSPPPPYQEGAAVPPAITQDYTAPSLRAVRKYGRGVPDVAAHADMQTGYKIYFGGQWTLCGGTSAAAPLWAALILCLNEQLKTPVGFIHPLLYKLQLGGQSVCRTITRGNNGGFEARPELLWNACTGLGSPDFEALSRALSALLSQERASP